MQSKSQILNWNTNCKNFCSEILISVTLGTSKKYIRKKEKRGTIASRAMRNEKEGGSSNKCTLSLPDHIRVTVSRNWFKFLCISFLKNLSKPVTNHCSLRIFTFANLLNFILTFWPHLTQRDWHNDLTWLILQLHGFKLPQIQYFWVFLGVLHFWGWAEQTHFGELLTQRNSQGLVGVQYLEKMLTLILFQTVV